MIVNNFNLKNLTITPRKTNPPLIIDPDAVMPFPVSFQGFQPVAGGNAQIVQRHRPVEHPQFPQGNALQVLGQFSGRLTIKELFCLPVPEPFNYTIDRITLNVI